MASYPDDRPYPSVLLLGYEDETPVHIVAAVDPETRMCHIVTVYRPNEAHWEEGFRKRR